MYLSLVKRLTTILAQKGCYRWTQSGHSIDPCWSSIADKANLDCVDLWRSPSKSATSELVVSKLFNKPLLPLVRSSKFNFYTIRSVRNGHCDSRAMIKVASTSQSLSFSRESRIEIMLYLGNRMVYWGSWCQMGHRIWKKKMRVAANCLSDLMFPWHAMRRQQVFWCIFIKADTFGDIWNLKWDHDLQQFLASYMESVLCLMQSWCRAILHIYILPIRHLCLDRRRWLVQNSEWTILVSGNSATQLDMNWRLHCPYTCFARVIGLEDNIQFF